MWIDFQNSFVGIFSMYTPQRLPPHLKYVATHYLVKVENPKMLPNFHIEPDN